MQSAAIVGNLESASNFEIYATSENEDLQGIGQWSEAGTNRFQRLIRFSTLFDPKATWKTFSTQLQFVMYELRTTQNLANKKLLQSENIEDASNAITKYYIQRKINNPLDFSKSAFEEVVS